MASPGRRTRSSTRSSPGTSRRSSTRGTASNRSTVSGSSRFDTNFSTGTRGLTNARTRIVGDRTGVLADAVVAVVRVANVVRRAASRLGGRLAAVVTPLGWAMLVVAPVALALGYLLGWIELVVAGWIAVGLLVIALVVLFGRATTGIALEVAHKRVVVGDRATGVVTVTNAKRPRPFGLTVEVPVGAGLAELIVPGGAQGARRSQEFIIPTARRGVLAVGPVRTVRADPVGLVRRELNWTEIAEVFVHPRTIAIPSSSTGLVRDLEGNPTADLSDNDVSFHALREYQPGDERRYIHWRSTARTGRLMVRQFEETRRSHLVIALSLAAGDYASDEEFELAVSAAGSLGARAIRDTRSVTIVASETTPEFAKRKVFAVSALSTLSRAHLLDDLAVVERAETALAVADLARVTGEQSSGASVAFLVCGSGATAQDLRAAATMFPPGVEVIAVVCNPEATPGLRRVVGLTLLTIGYLDDLKKALARSAAV